MTKSFDVDDQSAAVEQMAEFWPMIDALVGGTAAMRKAGKAFLPQFPNEDDSAYKTRLACSVLFPAFIRTANVMAAKPMSKAVAVNDGLPANIVEWLDDVDQAGTTLHAFASERMLEVMQYGLTGVLVEYPTLEGIRTRADEQKAGARPYFATYPAKNILGWKTKRGVDGIELAQLRLMECAVEDDGEFGEKMVEQVRVLTPGAWAIYRKSEQDGMKDEWVLYQQGTTTLDRIPFVFFYGIKTAFGCGVSPLLDLAFQNVEHWQSSSDQQNILHVARVPILFGKGFNEDDKIVVGASTACTTTNADADLSYVEHTGAAIEAGRQSILDLEDRMRQTGAELLVQRPAVTTATQTVSEGEGNKSILQRIVEAFEESLEECIELMGLWVNETFDAEVELFKDFGATNLSDQSSDILLRAADAGHVSPQTVFEQLQRRDIISPDLAWEDEMARMPKIDPPSMSKKNQPPA